ncbi:polygalacturonase inhibitor-like [Nymphaea colorata]|nr:polygalacturonase inhibitor-like [Nymphaea colorata]
MPRFSLLLPLLLCLLFFCSFSHATRFRCHPEDKQLLDQLFNMTLDFDCCAFKPVGCNVNTSWIESLDISDDRITGTIPPVLGKMTNLIVLQIKESRSLVGDIPPAIAKLTKLTFLRIAFTNFSGPIPSWISQLKELEYLDLSYNKLTGPIPSFLFDLPKLKRLRLDRNQLTGTIPESSGRFRGTELYLGLNQLSGAVPLSLGRMDFEHIELQRNRFVGNPSHLFNNRSKSLSYIDLSRNLFDFDLTNVVFPVKNLYHVDLSHNAISGSIPEQAAEVPALSLFNVSYNRLCGRIPNGGQLQNIESYSYLHNKCLCGPPLSTKC